MYQDINNKSFQEKISSNPDAVILDVRTEVEYSSSTIQNAININIFESSFQRKIEALDKNKVYLVYCRSGNRSGQACGMMDQLGFTEIYNLDRGIMMWDGELVSPFAQTLSSK